MEEAKLLKLTLVTPPDYFNAAGYKLVCLGSPSFQADVKQEVYTRWPESEITLYSSDYDQTNSDWILHAASVAHFTIVEMFGLIPLWIAEYVKTSPHIYVGPDSLSNIRILKRKDPRLTAETVEAAITEVLRQVT